ncbi:MAG: Uma2 family endonuclease [Cyanobacteriota bacterium]|nr:Uma2 family endonuclease [Cyanobacteriota bacterium]
MTNLSVQSDPPLSARQTLPTMYDLPSENPEEPGLPDDFHYLQAALLRLTFMPGNWYPDLVFSGCDLNLYYNVNHPSWYKRPDWFGVVGVPPLYQGRDLRLSYVVWQEEVPPLVVVELLSPGTEDDDLGQKVRSGGKPNTKWEVYERVLRVPYYVVFSRYTNKMQAFCLAGDRYEPTKLTDGRLSIPSIELSLGLWQGSYSNIDRLWLRWMTLDGNLILTPEEEAAAAKQENDRLKARLRELGIDPDE